MAIGGVEISAGDEADAVVAFCRVLGSLRVGVAHLHLAGCVDARPDGVAAHPPLARPPHCSGLPPATFPPRCGPYWGTEIFCALAVQCSRIAPRWECHGTGQTARSPTATRPRPPLDVAGRSQRSPMTMLPGCSPWPPWWRRPPRRGPRRQSRRARRPGETLRP